MEDDPIKLILKDSLIIDVCAFTHPRFPIFSNIFYIIKLHDGIDFLNETEIGLQQFLVDFGDYIEHMTVTENYRSVNNGVLEHNDYPVFYNCYKELIRGVGILTKFILKYCRPSINITWQRIDAVPMEVQLFKNVIIENTFQYLDTRDIFNTMEAFGPTVFGCQRWCQTFLEIHISNRAVLFDQLWITCSFSGFNISNNNNFTVKQLAYRNLEVLLQCIGHQIKVIDIYSISDNYGPVINNVLKLIPLCGELVSLKIGGKWLSELSAEIKQTFNVSEIPDRITLDRNKINIDSIENADELYDSLKKGIYKYEKVDISTDKYIGFVENRHFDELIKLNGLNTLTIAPAYSNISKWQFFQDAPLHPEDVVFGQLDNLIIKRAKPDNRLCRKSFLTFFEEISRLITTYGKDRKGILNFTIANYDFSNNFVPSENILLYPAGTITIKNCTIASDANERDFLSYFPPVNGLTIINSDIPSLPLTIRHPNGSFQLTFINCQQLTGSKLFEIYKNFVGKLRAIIKIQNCPIYDDFFYGIIYDALLEMEVTVSLIKDLGLPQFNLEELSTISDDIKSAFNGGWWVQINGEQIELSIDKPEIYV